MVRILLIIIMFSFTLASGGAHKLVLTDGETITNSGYSETLSSIKTIECCKASNHSDADVDNPRCLGDNCISPILEPSLPYSYSGKISSSPILTTFNMMQYRFLRPPIV